MKISHAALVFPTTGVPLSSFGLHQGNSRLRNMLYGTSSTFTLLNARCTRNVFRRLRHCGPPSRPRPILSSRSWFVSPPTTQTHRVSLAWRSATLIFFCVFPPPNRFGSRTGPRCTQTSPAARPRRRWRIAPSSPAARTRPARSALPAFRRSWTRPCPALPAAGEPGMEFGFE